MPGLLDVTAAEGARRIALTYLAQAHEASKGLDDPSDAEALHDFRVGMRRLRSCLRAYHPILGEAAGGKLAKRIRKIAAATNPGRDAEVQLEWVRALGDTEDPQRAPGVRWLAERLEAQKDEAYAHARRELVAAFDELERKLRARLSTYTVEFTVGVEGPMARFPEALAAALETQRQTLLDGLAQVHGVEDEALAHRARLYGKRLRYLLEPVRGELDEAKALVGELKALQDLLGDLNDLHNLNQTLGAALEESAVDRARRLREAATQLDFDLETTLAQDERAGLLAMLQRVQADRRRLFDALMREWLAEGGRLSALSARLKGLLASLREPPVPLEIERKFLLRELPPACREVEPKTMDQGYLPGRKLIERVRRVRTSRSETHRRTVKLGSGVRRVEIEEGCDAALFSALWALTAGRRVRKRRYALPDGAHVWEIDAFDDRELTLAEIELAREDEEVAFPDWLAPYVEREVTDEPAYLNVNLAK
jgi:CHAD domain-containing protein/CYTH domain-containing protein